MKNTKIRILSFILAAAMLTGCGASAESDSKAESSKPESSQGEPSDSKTDSEAGATASDSSGTDSSEDDSSDSSSDESSEATTTTKTSEESKTETEKTVTTTTKQSSTTTSAVATQPVATKATAKPVVTTKATKKPTVTAKQTTKATTKATPKATSKQTADPTANMSPYYKALYRIGSGKGTASDYETVRTEIINYGKKLYPKYKLNPNLHLYRLPNGKLTDDYQTGVTFNEITCREACELPTSSLEDIRAFDNDVRCLVVENLSWYGGYDPNEFNITWYVQFSKQQIGTCVIVLAKAE